MAGSFVVALNETIREQKPRLMTHIRPIARYVQTTVQIYAYVTIMKGHNHLSHLVLRSCQKTVYWSNHQLLHLLAPLPLRWWSFRRTSNTSRTNTSNARSGHPPWRRSFRTTINRWRNRINHTTNNRRTISRGWSSTASTWTVVTLSRRPSPRRRN